MVVRAIFAEKSQIEVDSLVTFSHNVVTSSSGKGGAIYIQDDNCENIFNTEEECSIKYRKYDFEVGDQFNFFLNNSATYGSVLYGGLLDRCSAKTLFTQTPGMKFFKLVSTVAAITSDPVKICFCNNIYQPDCTIREIVETKMRGETVTIVVASVDQDQNLLSSVIRANYDQTTANLGEGEGRNKLVKQLMHKTSLSYLHN